MTEERDPYAVLGVPSTANQEDVAAAYRAKARLHHPDVSLERDAERRMAEINAAWSILRDPARREAWDRANGVGQPAPTGPIAARTRDRAATSGAGTGGGAPRADTLQGSVTWRRGPEGEGAAGPPPGNPRGSVLPFGRHIGWSIGEVARIELLRAAMPALRGGTLVTYPGLGHGLKPVQADALDRIAGFGATLERA